MRLNSRHKDLFVLIYFASAVLAVVLTLCFSAGAFKTQAATPKPDLAPASGVMRLPAVDRVNGVRPRSRRVPRGQVEHALGVFPPSSASQVRAAQYRVAAVPRENESPRLKLNIGEAKPQWTAETSQPGGHAVAERAGTSRPPGAEFAFAPTPAPSSPPPLPPGPHPAVKIPLSTSVAPEAVRIDVQDGMVSIVVRGAPLDEVLGILAQQQGLNVITAEDITARVSVTLDNVPFEQALTQILSVAGYTWVRQENVLIITSIATGNQLSPYAQGREVRVFRLDYVAAADVDLVVKGLLSPAGQSFVTESASSDDRKTQESVVVEDLSEYLGRIEQYIRQVDVAPRQVLIEAHVLSIELKDEIKHGINLQYLDSLGVPSLTLKTQGLANAAALAAGTSPAFFFNIAASDLNALLEALETTTDSKTLATPKVLALNGQEARIQIGAQLGYRVTTTTQTSTLESVNFLDTGVVLTVTPRITEDDCVIMQVKPEVSSGEVNVTTELPEEETTEVETALMLPNGHGMLIGGLIQELDTEKETKVPFVGDLWMIGRLFQKHEIERKRTEIIIALIPHVVPYGPLRHQRECEQFHRATEPLVHGPLLENLRPHEPRFPNAGQRLPLPYKLQHLRTLPDNSAWMPQGSLEHCFPGIAPFPSMHDGVGPFPKGVGEQGEIPTTGEIVPAPVAQPVE